MPFKILSDSSCPSHLIGLLDPGNVTPGWSPATYFAHGDASTVIADGSTAYFCRLCDLFGRAAHFETAHPWWEHLSRYARSLEIARSLAKEGVVRAAPDERNWCAIALCGGTAPPRREWRQLVRLWGLDRRTQTRRQRNTAGRCARCGTQLDDRVQWLCSRCGRQETAA
jgi:hypothetical protein